MAVAYISEFPIGDRSTEKYEFMKEKLAGEQIDGLIVHTAGFDDATGCGGWSTCGTPASRPSGSCSG